MDAGFHRHDGLAVFPYDVLRKKFHIFWTAMFTNIAASLADALRAALICLEATPRPRLEPGPGCENLYARTGTAKYRKCAISY